MGHWAALLLIPRFIQPFPSPPPPQVIIYIAQLGEVAKYRHKQNLLDIITNIHSTNSQILKNDIINRLWEGVCDFLKLGFTL